MSDPVQFLQDSQYKCQRCNNESAVLIARKEKFCAGCFVFFMKGKQRKLMLDERYKVKYGAVAERLGTQKVLLPLSFGISSLVLLDMIASLLQEQNLAHKGKQGFELMVMCIEEEENATKIALLDKLLASYSPVKIDYKVVTLDSYIVDPLMRLRVSETFAVIGKTAPEETLTIPQLLEHASTRSLRADLLSIIRSELIFHTAHAEQCQTILFGHSMTRLANEVISLTVKGRGLEIHTSVVDRTASYAGKYIHIIFPLRDILFAEISAVMKLSSHLAEYVVIKEQKSFLVKNMTVEALVGQYFSNLDATGYASTASTVVKTAEKLGAPKASVTAVCRVCGAEIHQDPRQWVNEITVSKGSPLTTEEEKAYAKQYSDAMDEDASGEIISACYGCTVTLIGAGDGFTWPVRATKQEILDEYVLE